MSDHLTACLAAQEANVRQFLEDHGHIYVETLGPFADGDLVLNIAPPPAERARLQGPGPKVLVHTTGP